MNVETTAAAQPSPLNGPRSYMPMCSFLYQKYPYKDFGIPTFRGSGWLIPLKQWGVFPNEVNHQTACFFTFDEALFNTLHTELNRAHVPNHYGIAAKVVRHGEAFIVEVEGADYREHGLEEVDDALSRRDPVLERREAICKNKFYIGVGDEFIEGSAVYAVFVNSCELSDEDMDNFKPFLERKY